MKLSGDLSKQEISDKARFAIIGALIILGVASRLLPHPPNFAPITALALFGGALIPGRAGLWLPLAAMVVSDFFIGFHGLILFTWGAFFLIALFSKSQLSKNLNLTNLGGTTVAASVFFFLATNFGVWLQGFLYPRTFEGLADAYMMALPFFRNTLLGDLFFTGIIFGAYYFAVRFVHWLNTKPAKIAV
ncbi:MAG: DUF6580 family putative transport protein [Candidatus Saccharimonadales bacterium]|nr:DUF6580 family putative transport protein [Candidatus Saccharimonadales bacterium]